jgi:hypothetical protein
MLKVNQIISEWKEGDIHGLEWLRSRGISQRLAYKYFESGYLKKISSGVFVKANDKINPFAVIRYLQEELKLELHISGKSSLELQGQGHYLQMNEKTKLSLLSYESRSFPNWLKELNNYEFDLIFKKSSLLNEEKFLTDVKTENGFNMKISCRELAILELIDELDLSNSLETAENYLEYLSTLRPNIVQNILEECNSVKVKRVFLYLAEKLELPFFDKLNLDKINQGKGKRVIVVGGVLDKKYEITVERVEKVEF